MTLEAWSVKSDCSNLTNQTWPHSDLTDQTFYIIDRQRLWDLTLKMTSVQVFETSITDNSSVQSYSHVDDLAIL